MIIIYIIYLLSGINQVVVGGARPVITLYASSLGAAPAQIGVIVSVFAVLPALLAIYIGQWIDRFGFRRMILIGESGLLASLIIPLVYPHVSAFIVSQAIMGLAFTCQVVALQKRVGSGEVGDMDKRIATFSLFASVGAMVGPSFSAHLYERFSFGTSYAVNAVMILLGMAVTIAVRRGLWETGKGRAVEEADARIGESVWSMLRQRNLRNAVVTSGLAVSGREVFSAYFPLLGQSMMSCPEWYTFIRPSWLA